MHDHGGSMAVGLHALHYTCVLYVYCMCTVCVLYVQVKLNLVEKNLLRLI